MYGAQAMATWWCTAPQRTSRSGGPQRPPCGAAGRTVSPTTPPSPSTSRCWASHYHAYVQHVLGTLLQPQGCSGHGSSNGLCCSTPAILHLCRMSCPCKGVWQARREAQVQRSDNLVACAGLRRVHHGQHGRRHPALGGRGGHRPLRPAGPQRRLARPRRRPQPRRPRQWCAARMQPGDMFLVTRQIMGAARLSPGVCSAVAPSFATRICTSGGGRRACGQLTHPLRQHQCCTVTCCQEML